jgi:NAD(P)-dependent dehydrogenase (short-subunit alcohol dehydrogenase family)
LSELTTAVRAPQLSGQTVVVIGGGSGMGFETALRARAEDADVIIAGRNPDRLRRAATELGARDSAVVDATDPASLDQFFDGLPATIDHVMVTAGGPYYAPLANLEHTRAIREFDEHLWLAVEVAGHAVGRVRDGGTLLFMAGTGARQPALGQALSAAGTADVAALAVHIMINTALTGSTYDIDGGQQLLGS